MAQRNIPWWRTHGFMGLFVILDKEDMYSLKTHLKTVRKWNTSLDDDILELIIEQTEYYFQGHIDELIDEALYEQQKSHEDDLITAYDDGFGDGRAEGEWAADEEYERGFNEGYEKGLADAAGDEE